MSRYIDVDVIDKKVSDAYDTWTDDTAEHVVARNLLKSTRKFLLELPSIDIVFCKDCKFWKKVSSCMSKRPNGYCDEGKRINEV